MAVSLGIKEKLQKNIQPASTTLSLSRPVVSSCYHKRATATNTKERGLRLVWLFERKLNIVSQRPDKKSSFSLFYSFFPSGHPGNHCFMGSMNADGQKVVWTEERPAQGQCQRACKDKEKSYLVFTNNEWDLEKKKKRQKRLYFITCDHFRTYVSFMLLCTGSQDSKNLYTDYSMFVFFLSFFLYEIQEAEAARPGTNSRSSSICTDKQQQRQADIYLSFSNHQLQKHNNNSESLVHV